MNKDARSDTLTVKFKIKDREAMEPLWDAAKKNQAILGGVPRGLAWGDLFQERDTFQELVAILEEQLLQDPSNWPCASEELPETVVTKCGKKFYLMPAGNYSSYEGSSAHATEVYMSLADLEEVYGATNHGT